MINTCILFNNGRIKTKDKEVHHQVFIKKFRAKVLDEDDLKGDLKGDFFFGEKEKKKRRRSQLPFAPFRSTCKIV